MTTVQTSTVPDVLDRLAALLETRKGLDGNALTGVTILTAPSGDPDPLESIQFIEVPDDTHEWESMGGRRRKERYLILGAIFIARIGPGDAIAKAARDRAYAIAGEMQQVAWDNATLADIATRTDIQYSSGGLRQGYNTESRVADLSFAISVVSLLER